MHSTQLWKLDGLIIHQLIRRKFFTKTGHRETPYGSELSLWRVRILQKNKFTRKNVTTNLFSLRKIKVNIIQPAEKQSNTTTMTSIIFSATVFACVFGKQNVVSGFLNNISLDINEIWSCHSPSISSIRCRRRIIQL